MASPHDAASRRVTTPGATLVIPVPGELDLAEAPALRERLLAAVTAGYDDVVLDLSGTTFVDSSGLSVIITAYKRLQAQGGRLRVTGAAGLVRSVLDVTGLDHVLTLDDDPGREVARVRGESRGGP